MSKCQVIPLQGKVRAKQTEVKSTSFSAMLADGVAGVLPEQRHARIYAFHRSEPANAYGLPTIVNSEGPVHHGPPRQDC